MIYITGDTHGGFQRFNTRNFPQQKQMNRSDYVVVTGDFGGVWDDSPREAYWLNWLEEKPFTTLFVDGTTKTSTGSMNSLSTSGRAGRSAISVPIYST